MKVGSKVIHAPAYHCWSLYRAQHPYYDTALPRLADYLARRDGAVTMIDVGANIGTTIALVAAAARSVRCLAVEGDEESFELLVRNTANLPGVLCEHALVSDISGTMNVGFLASGTGTARPVNGTDLGSGQTVSTTVDELVRKHPEFGTANILKVDTDGYDYKVIKGAEQFLRRAHPVLYFELSPGHHAMCTRDDVRSIFPWLRDVGYQKVLLYDNCGYPFMVIDTSDAGLISQCVEYAQRKPYFYFDVLAVPVSRESDLDQFVEGERATVPPFEWPAGERGPSLRRHRIFAALVRYVETMGRPRWPQSLAPPRDVNGDIRSPV